MRPRPRPESVVLATLLASVLLAVLRLSLVRAFNGDELEALHTGWKVLQGGRPYFDFFQHHHPYHYYVLARVIDLCGEGAAALRAARLLHLGALLAILGLTARIAREVFGRGVALAAVVLLATTVIFVQKAIEVRPDVLQTLFGLLAVALFLGPGGRPEPGSRRALFLAGVCLGVSFLFLQKSLFLAALLALLGLGRVVARRMPAADLAWAAAGCLLALAPEYAWMATTASLETYWQLNWRLNVPTEHAFGPTYGMVESYQENTVLWLFFALGVPLAWGAGAREGDPRRREVAVLALGLLLSLFVVKRPWPQYYMLPLPLMAVVASHAVRTHLAARPRVAAALVVLGAVPGVYRLAFDRLYTNERQLRAIEWACSVTGPSERIHDGRSSVNVFREDLDWFWFSVRDNGMLDRYRTLIGPYPYDPVELALRLRPRVVVASALDVEDPRIAALYRPSRGFRDLWVLRGTEEPATAAAAPRGGGRGRDRVRDSR